MDHNLDDSLNLDSAMGVDFEPPGDAVVSQADISLDAGSHETSMPMEFESIEEQPMLMDAENEQIIGYSDDQFNLHEYGVQDEPAGANTTIVSSEEPMSQSDTMLDIQFDPQSFTSSPIKIESQVQQPKIIQVKAAIPRVAAKKDSAIPRQVAIAPKPLGLKPLTIAARPQIVKKVSIAGVVQQAQGKTVLAQIGKQLVMVPGNNPKIKLVAAGGGALPNIQYIRANQGDQPQIITTKNLSGAKPMLTKFIIQGQPGSDSGQQPAVITKLMGAPPQARFVTMTQKTVPISMPNKVLVTSPSKQTVRITKKQHIVEIKSPTTAKFIPATQGGTKKVVITAAPTQNVILKTTAPPKNPQITKDGNITVQGQRTQLHQINVPGKGIQYIRLVTSGAPRAQPVKQNNTVVLADAKGNVIQMASDKVQAGQPPPLVIAGTAAALNKLAARPQQKLVRIAPVGSKPALAVTSVGRSMQSLLAPLSPRPPRPAPVAAPVVTSAPAAAAPAEDEVDSKAELQALLAGDRPKPPEELEIEYEGNQSVGDENSNSNDQTQDSEYKDSMEPLIVIPNYLKPQDSRSDDYSRIVKRFRTSPQNYTNSNSNDQTQDSEYKDSMEPLIVIPNYLKPQDSRSDDYSRDDGKRFSYEAQAQSFHSYQAPPTPQPVSEGELVSTELGMRPRKACNCTKSQCLKLYCDCFANGEFCHRCNCNNCHNNLENEELRQKAIRGCLDRNPNAFRPKIGKAKSGGPEIVRRHNKGCNCKRSGCLKNYCECYEAKIACTAMCKCVGCRNVEESVSRRRDRARDSVFRPAALPHINFMTTEVIEAVCQCLLAAAGAPAEPLAPEPDPVRDVIDEFSRCLQDIITAAHHSAPILDETRA